ncbi:MAG TPA: antibiotic biosynthesis monooxygenase family protein [Acidimicrobiales bacterium]|nr:antibiotic biosynthesis monooxygenase family protein [Acidimicrobiales bacterium]
MSILVLLSVEAPEGQEDAVRDKLREILVATRAFDGCEDVAVWQDEDRPTSFVVVETWVSREHSDAYSEWRAGRVEQDGFRAMLAAPGIKRHYDLTDA